MKTTGKSLRSSTLKFDDRRALFEACSMVEWQELMRVTTVKAVNHFSGGDINVVLEYYDSKS